LSNFVEDFSNKNYIEMDKKEINIVPNHSTFNKPFYMNFEFKFSHEKIDEININVFELIKDGEIFTLKPIPYKFAWQDLNLINKKNKIIDFLKIDRTIFQEPNNNIIKIVENKFLSIRIKDTINSHGNIVVFHTKGDTYVSPFYYVSAEINNKYDEFIDDLINYIRFKKKQLGKVKIDILNYKVKDKTIQLKYQLTSPFEKSKLNIKFIEPIKGFSSFKSDIKVSFTQYDKNDLALYRDEEIYTLDASEKKVFEYNKSLRDDTKYIKMIAEPIDKKTIRKEKTIIKFDTQKTSFLDNLINIFKI
jgi:hypothetical protein